MTRLQRTATSAAILLLGGGGIALYTLIAKVKTPEERHRIAAEEKRLFHFGRDHVRGLRLHAKSATVAITRDPSGWIMTEPTSFLADSVKVNAIIDRMAGIQMDPVITEDATPEELKNMGLDRPLARVEVELLDGKAVLWVGPKNLMTGQYPITDGARRKIGMATAEPIWAFDRTPSELKETRLFPLQPDEVIRLELGGQSQVLLEGKDRVWKVNGLEGDPGSIGRYLIRYTKHLKIDRFISDQLDATADTSRKSFGLDPVLATVTIDAVDGRKIKVEFGNYQETGDQEGTLVAHPLGTKSVVAIDPSFRADLAKNVDEFKNRTLCWLEDDQIHSIQIQVGDATAFTLRKNAEGLSAESGQQLPTARSTRLLTTWARLKADGVVTSAATPEELVKFRLEPPARRVVVQDSDGHTLCEVHIGDYASDANLRARIGGDKRVFLLNETKVALLPNSVADALKE